MNQTCDVRPDADLIRAYSAGESSALSHLANRHKDRLYTAIYVVVRDRLLAEDLLQETFLKIIRTVQGGRYDEQGKFLPWALRVAHNLCMDHFRRLRTGGPATLPDGRVLEELLAAPAESSGLEQRQTEKSVRAMIEALPPEQRTVVAMRIYGELSFKEIAEATGVSINTALGRMRYALINLRKMVASEGLVLR